FGLNLFISGFRFKRPVTTVYRSVVPFILLLVVALGLTTYVPELSTWSSDLEEPLSLEPAAPEAEAEPDSTGEPEPPAETLDDLMGGDTASEGETLEDLKGGQQAPKDDSPEDLLNQGAPG